MTSSTSFTVNISKYKIPNIVHMHCYTIHHCKQSLMYQYAFKLLMSTLALTISCTVNFLLKYIFKKYLFYLYIKSIHATQFLIQLALM